MWKFHCQTNTGCFYIVSVRCGPNLSEPIDRHVKLDCMTFWGTFSVVVILKK